MQTPPLHTNEQSLRSRVYPPPTARGSERGCVHKPSMMLHSTRRKADFQMRYAGCSRRSQAKPNGSSPLRRVSVYRVYARGSRATHSERYWEAPYEPVPRQNPIWASGAGRRSLNPLNFGLIRGSPWWPTFGPCPLAMLRLARLAFGTLGAFLRPRTAVSRQKSIGVAE
jgi:hypothetical protein